MIDLEHLPDVGDPRLPTFFDELPIWSAPFGLALLDLVTLRPGIAALDIGPGTGFPALELAQRLGSTASVIGVDPWGAALEWARARATFLGLDNVRLVEGAAEFTSKKICPLFRKAAASAATSSAAAAVTAEMTRCAPSQADFALSRVATFLAAAARS